MLNRKKTLKTRDTCPKNLENLKLELTNIDWTKYLSVNDVITENVNQVFNKCHDKLLDIINKHAPVRKRIVTEKKFRKEAWITPSILNCCKSRKDYINRVSKRTPLLSKLSDTRNIERFSTELKEN